MSELEIPFRNLGQAGGQQTTHQIEAAQFGDDEDDLSRGLRVRRTVENASGMQRAWQMVAKENYRFNDGHQWEDYDRMIMQQSRRPILTFNEIRKIVRAVCGLERLNRTDVRFVSRALDSPTIEDIMGDLATEVVSTVEDISNAPYERSLAFRDLVLGGMGWMETFVSFDEDLDGQLDIMRLPPFEMFWDIYARRQGLVDRRWCARRMNMPREKFKKRWPDKVSWVDAAAPEPEEWRVQKYELVTPYYSLANERVNPQVGEQGPQRSTIPVIQYQERYEVDVYRIADPDNPNKLLEFSKKAWNELKRDFDVAGMGLPAVVRQTKMVHRQIYVAHGICLEDPVMIPGNRFSLECMTGEWDEERKIWVGLVGDMIDPQKTKNKALSTALHFYLTNAKGGVMFETGAFVNDTRAKDEWSAPNPWIPVNNGMLDKIKPRTPTDMPNALQAFFEIGTRSISEVAGISQELLGLGQAEMGNQTQQSRLSGTLAILGWLWDEYARFKKGQAQTTLEFAREFMTDGRLIQIGGMFNSKAIPLFKQNLPEPLQYTLETDESIKHNPNLKAQLWKDILPQIPAILRFVGPQAILYLMKFSPYPTQLVKTLEQFAQQQQQNPQNQQKGRGKQESPEMQQAKVAKTQADVQKTLAQARSIDSEMAQKTAELFLEGMKVSGDLANKQKSRANKNMLDTLGMIQSLMGGRSL